ncbi:MAG TPA: LCP family protein [Candidatus Dormibacteraeota bacterium]|nr:LCP family protein [Candidatus Dormibacteraeota bacterium]
MATRAAASPRRSAALAAALSFVLPGLGQGWLGAFRRGLIMALPVLLLIGFGIGIIVFQGRARAVGLLLQPGVLIALLILNAALLAWRAGAIVDAWRLARRASPSGGGGRTQQVFAATVLAVLLVATLGMHVAFGYLYLYKSYDFVTTAFVTPEPSPSGTPGPTPSGAEPTPEPTPAPIWSADGRLDLLLVGGDSGPGRFGLRTDTMILLSVDVSNGQAAMFGIPRNMTNVPLPDGPADAFPACRCFPDILNGLYVYADENPQWFAGGEARGYMALQGAVSELTGLSLDGMLVVTLQGFVELVDTLGGLDIYTPYSLYDALYPHEDGSHHEVLWIPAGRHHFDGHTALAFARSRNQDSDYDRMWRQQLTLKAIREQLDPCTLIVRIPELLDIARDALWTNMPIEQLPDLLSLAARVKTAGIARYQFWPPDIPETLDQQGIALIREMVVDPFPAGATPGARPSASASPSQAPPDSGC